MFVQKFLSQIHTCGWLFPIMLALTVSGCMLEFPFATDDISGGRGGAGSNRFASSDSVW